MLKGKRAAGVRDTATPGCKANCPRQRSSPKNTEGRKAKQATSMRRQKIRPAGARLLCRPGGSGYTLLGKMEQEIPACPLNLRVWRSREPGTFGYISLLQKLNERTFPPLGIWRSRECRQTNRDTSRRREATIKLKSPETRETQGFPVIWGMAQLEARYTRLHTPVTKIE